MRLRATEILGILLFIEGLVVLTMLPFTSNYRISHRHVVASILEMDEGNWDNDRLANLTLALDTAKMNFEKGKDEFQSAIDLFFEAMDRESDGTEGISEELRGPLRVRITDKAILNDEVLRPGLYIALVFGGIILGGLFLTIPGIIRRLRYVDEPDDVVRPDRTLRFLGIFSAFLLLACLVTIWAPYYVVEWLQLVHPLSETMTGEPAGKWFLIAVFAIIVLLLMMLGMLGRPRHGKVVERDPELEY